MDNSSNSTAKAEIDTGKNRSHNYSSILKIVGFGWVASILLAFFANTSLAFEKGDSAGANFYVLAFLSVTVLLISIMVGSVKGAVRVFKRIGSKEGLAEEVISFFFFMLGICLIVEVTFKILSDAW